MNQWGFYYDQTRCLGCKTCAIACKNWNDQLRGDANINVELSWLTTATNPSATDPYLNPSAYESLPGSDGSQRTSVMYRKYNMKENWRRVTKTEYGSVYPNIDVLDLSLACNHCNTPACVEVCPMQIIYKESTYGIVLVDNTNCISCGKCQDACPWGAPQYYDPNFRSYTQADPLRPKMTKCTLCIERISAGLKPACVAACMNRALDAGPLTDLKAQYPNWAPGSVIVNFPSDAVPTLGINTGPSIIFKPRTPVAGGQGTIQSY